MRLVIQGTVAPEHLRHLSHLAATPPIRLSARAYCLDGDGGQYAQISAYCATHRLDCARVPRGLDFGRIGLVVMDMDSTLIALETIDEIADLQGLKPQVAAITESAMRGEIDYAESLRRRVALLAGEDESALRRVYEERLRLNPGAAVLLGELRKHGIKTMLLSGGFSYFTERLKDSLGLDYAAANTLEIIDGRLSGRLLGDIIDAQGKADWLARVRDGLGLAEDQVVAIGDGANDSKMLAAAGFGIAYHAKPLLRGQADCAIDHVGLEGVLPLLAAGRAASQHRETHEVDYA